MSAARQTRQFGRRENRIVITTNGNSREYRISANILILCAVVFCTFMTGYIGATAYLAFREDLVAGTLIRQARMQHEYEDRIAALRSRVDRITSRQLLDQQAVEAKVADLMQRQEMLSGRNGTINGLIEKARENGLAMPASQTPHQKAAIDHSQLDTMTTGSLAAGSERRPTIVALADAGTFLRGSTFAGQSGAALGLENESGLAAAAEDIAASRRMPVGHRHFDGVRNQIAVLERNQSASLMALQHAARQKMEKLTAVYEKLNIKLPDEMTENTGGPFVASMNMEFTDLAENVTLTLNALAGLKRKVRKLPVANPLPGAKITSKFGNRIDPFNRRSAFHAGIDFRAARGTPVQATGNGQVIHASRKGGYGLMVEIDHGNGITTRYAHLSRVLVKRGARVKSGDIIGKVGSTGRSTGPHLHYEVRRYEKAANPSRFLSAGQQIDQL